MKNGDLVVSWMGFHTRVCNSCFDSLMELSRFPRLKSSSIYFRQMESPSSRTRMALIIVFFSGISRSKNRVRGRDGHNLHGQETGK